MTSRCADLRNWRATSRLTRSQWLTYWSVDLLLLNRYRMLIRPQGRLRRFDYPRIAGQRRILVPLLRAPLASRS